MKKSFIAIAAACMLLMGGTAFAGQPNNPGSGWYEKINGENAGELKFFKKGHPENNSEWVFVTTGTGDQTPATYTADLSLKFSAIDEGYSKSVSDLGTGNDWAEAGGWGGMTGKLSLFANGKYSAFVDGTLDGKGKVNVTTFAWDGDQQSSAFSKAESFGTAYGVGKAVGVGGLNENITGNLTFTGSLYENTYAAELGYTDGGISGGQGGNISWSDYDKIDVDITGCGALSAFDTYEGYAFIEGKTLVSIDPYGSHRSFEGETYTKAYAPGSVTVDFSGGVAGYVVDGYSGISASANYKADGATANNTYGNARINGSLVTNGTGVVAQVSGQAFSGATYSNVPR